MIGKDAAIWAANWAIEATMILTAIVGIALTIADAWADR